MTIEEAREYAKKMTYRNAVYNALQGKCIPYRKATLMKLHELLNMVEPKTGRWIWEIDETPSTYMSPSGLNYAGWVCSCCHEFPDDVCEWDDPDEPPTYKFCPNCGAKMIEPQESEDKECR